MELHWALTLWHAGCMLAPWGASRGMLSDHAWQSQLLGCSYFTFTLFHICTKYQWGSFTQLRDPQKYNENKKPSEMRLTPSYHSSVSRLVPPQQLMSMLTPICIYLNPHGLWTFNQYHQPHSLWSLARTALSSQNLSQVQLSQPGFNTSTAIPITTIIITSLLPLLSILRWRVIEPLINLPGGACQLKSFLAG